MKNLRDCDFDKLAEEMLADPVVNRAYRQREKERFEEVSGALLQLVADLEAALVLLDDLGRSDRIRLARAPEDIRAALRKVGLPYYSE